MFLEESTEAGVINSLETWFDIAPPMGGITQWRDGRSAKELARYMTNAFPHMPAEIEAVLSPFANPDSCFKWGAEYVTEFSRFGYGLGMGRNHDAVIFDKNIFVGIEGKADEPFGDKTIEDELKKASANKAMRINKLVKLVFGDAPENHLDLRYQLLTACGGVVLEAQERKIPNALLLVVVFLKEGVDEFGRRFYEEERRQENHKDWKSFLQQIKAKELPNGSYKVPMCEARNGINLYVQKIEIKVK